MILKAVYLLVSISALLRSYFALSKRLKYSLTLVTPVETAVLLWINHGLTVVSSNGNCSHHCLCFCRKTLTLGLEINGATNKDVVPQYWSPSVKDV